MKPLLTVSDLFEGRKFPPVELSFTDEDLDLYRSVIPVRVNNRGVPPGVIAYLARLSYLRDHDMPPGGILRGLSLHWFGPVSLGQPFTIQAHVLGVEIFRGRPLIHIRATAFEATKRVFEIDLDALWPVSDE